MIPLIPTLVLALVSFLSSAFVILRIVIPVLPPHPLSRRVAPKEFGLPNFRSLSSADKSHIWLAVCDLIALAFFVWETIVENVGGPKDFDVARHPSSTIRIWIAMTLRQTLLLVVVALTLLYVRLGRPVVFGSKHWMICAPTALLLGAATAIAGILSRVGLTSLFVGYVAYSAAIAILTTAAFGWLVGTLMLIRRNLLATSEPSGTWPPVMDEKRPRPSFATEEIDALRDGSSWITSNASSHRRSMSGFSFSTYHSAIPSTHGSIRATNFVTGSFPSIPSKSSFWFSPATPRDGDPSIPPVPPLPSPYRQAAHTPTTGTDDPDPFRRSALPAVRLGSQSSWLTEPSASQVSLSAWSFPSTRPGSPSTGSADLHTDLLPSSRPVTPAMASAQVLGGYGYSPAPVGLSNAEKALSVFSALPAKDINVTIPKLLAWLSTIWVPLAFSFPYFFMVSPDTPFSSMAAPVFLILSVTVSSLLLACNILFCSPIPIPSGLFDSHSETTSVTPMPSPQFLGADENRYKRSGSVTFVEGRRSGDVWVSNGDAVDGKTKFGRAIGLLSSVPKLAVLPPGPEEQDGEFTPPLPMQTESPSTVAFTPQSANSAELGRKRKESKASSYYSGADDSLAFTTRIMTAQRHYSAVATTMVLPPSPEKRISGFTSSTFTREHTHLRSRSTSSITQSNKFTVSGTRPPISPPPSSPLPPTPPREARHQRSTSSGFSFGAVNDINEIDRLSAGMLPLLVPGLKVGPNMKVKGSPLAKQTLSSGSSAFSSPELHSTPVRSRTKKTSPHKRHHLSLPSLGLGKDGIHSLANWKEDITQALASKVTVAGATEDGRRKTVWGGESIPNTHTHLRSVPEEDEMKFKSPNAQLEHSRFIRSFGPNCPPLTHADVPSGVDTARSSMATLIAALETLPPSATSTATLFNIPDGPTAQSTPRDARQTHAHALTHDYPATYTRRSSIVYIKSDENPPNSTRGEPGEAQAIRPIVPKSTTSKLYKLKSGAAHTGSPGLRQLSLLQDRDINRDEPRSGGVRPLALAKKHKQVENAVSTPHKLARSATSKARAILRKAEVLPEVVVRPPSTSSHTGFGYSFR